MTAESCWHCLQASVPSRICHSFFNPGFCPIVAHSLLSDCFNAGCQVLARAVIHGLWHNIFVPILGMAIACPSAYCDSLESSAAVTKPMHVQVLSQRD